MPFSQVELLKSVSLKKKHSSRGLREETRKIRDVQGGVGSFIGDGLVVRKPTKRGVGVTR